MAELRVGIRELKNKLSEYMRRVKAGYHRRGILITLNIFCLGLALFITACQPKPQLNSIINVPDPNSELAKTMNCSTALEDSDQWVWITRSLSQFNKDNADIMLCYLTGSYNPNPFNRYYFSVQYSLEKMQIKTILDTSSVDMNLLPNGHAVTTPNFVKVGRTMFSACREDSKKYICAIAAQYTDYVTFLVRLGGDINIPHSGFEKMANEILIRQDALIKQVLIP